ncbi:DUF3822 family protein [Litoribacter ruber]|uniref:DUF3822 family protein n=1 Tax=Litoribacter ruber TaxID=702568 RepID=UPI001BD9A267|nr:DUF3822 family protein [Litoribacter ruber]MBT0812362.1 DUF3822 family protein [Litoribacter ruber]
MKFKYLSDKFDTQVVSDLSLFLSKDNLLIIAKDSNGEVVAGESLPASELNSVLESNELLKSNPKTAKLWVHNDHFNLVPGVLFDQSQAATYLNYSSPLVQQEAHEVFSESLDSNNLHLVAAIDKATSDKFRKRFPEIKFGHAGALSLDYVLQQKNDYLGQEIFVIAEHGHIYLVAFSSQELKMFNRFEVSNTEELLKYVFVAFEQLNFDRNYCKVNLIGDLSSLGSNLEDLQPYFKNLIPITPRANTTYHSGAERLQETQRLETYWTL